MKTLQEQYNLISEGKGHKDVFLKEAKRLFPNMVTNAATFEETSKILKNRGVISEALGQVVTMKPINTIESSQKESWETKFSKFLAEEAKVEEKKVTKEVEEIQDHNFDYKDEKNLDNQIGQEVMNGIYFEAKQNPDKSIEEIKEIVSKNLAKDGQYYIKNAAFGVEGIGYQETELEEVSGKHAASGYSDKLKKVVKESLMVGGIVTTGNPDSIASQQNEVVKEMMDEVEEGYGAEEYEQGKKAGEEIEKKKMKKAKKESLDTELAEIDKQASIVALEAKLDKMDEVIEGKMTRINMVSEDENLSELVDKKKMKAMQKEVKILEKKKAKMEKMYEKMAGKKYQKEEIVDEIENLNEAEIKPSLLGGDFINKVYDYLGDDVKEEPLYVSYYPSAKDRDDFHAGLSLKYEAQGGGKYISMAVEHYPRGKDSKFNVRVGQNQSIDDIKDNNLAKPFLDAAEKVLSSYVSSPEKLKDITYSSTEMEDPADAEYLKRELVDKIKSLPITEY